jgi:hypothetical protein
MQSNRELHDFISVFAWTQQDGVAMCELISLPN